MPYTILICLVAVIGGFLFGFDSGVINGTVDGLQQAFQSDSAGTGFNVSSMLLGCAVGAFAAGRLADRFGRRACLIVTAVLFIVSAWGSGVSDSSLPFVIYRVIGGLAVGAASVLAPAYISEVAPARYRGTLATVQQFAIISGLFCAFLSNYLIAGAAGGSTSEFWFGHAAWRWMFWVEILPAGVFFLALFAIPESPRFLVAAGRREEARRILTRLLGRTSGEERVVEIDASLARDHHRPRFADLRRQPGQKSFALRPIAWLGIGLAVFQQLVGINVIFYYGAVLWQAAGFSEGDALLINIISAGLSFGACLAALLLIDRCGRKPLLLVGSVGMALTLGAAAVIFATAAKDVSGNLMLEGAPGVGALVAANLYVVFFNFSWGPVVWVLLGEMFPNQIRGAGLAVSGFGMWFANFGVTLTFPMLLAGIGLGGAYGIYAAFAVLSLFLVARYVRETRRVELEAMPG